MIELRSIEPSTIPPLNADWALIERAGGKVAAKGSLTRNRASTFGPALFEDLGSAIVAAKNWAALNGVDVIYFKDAA